MDARLAALEARMEYLATKEDIQKLEVWVLGGVIGAIIAGCTMAFGAARLFLGVQG